MEGTHSLRPSQISTSLACVAGEGDASSRRQMLPHSCILHPAVWHVSLVSFTRVVTVVSLILPLSVFFSFFSILLMKAMRKQSRLLSAGEAKRVLVIFPTVRWLQPAAQEPIPANQHALPQRCLSDASAMPQRFYVLIGSGSFTSS